MVSSVFLVTFLAFLITQVTFGSPNHQEKPSNDQSKGETLSPGSSTIKPNNQPSYPQVNPITPNEPEKANRPEDYVAYKTPQPHSMERVFLYESFDDVHRFKKTWIKSEATKGPDGQFKYDGTWDIVVTHQKIRGDYGLRMRSKSKHHAISRQFDRPFNFSNSFPLIVQYDVQYRNGQECGGAYLKLLSSPSGNLSLINDQSLYTIMFGPDKCGSDHRLHFIFAHVNNKTGERREIHWKDAHTLTNLADIVTDGKWHLFRLYVSPSNHFELSMDKRVIASGSLLTHFSPPVNPSKEIDDPNDIKPEDWDEREKVPDPDSVKPDDWDNGEPKQIIDSKAKKPKSWLLDEPLTIPDPEAVEPDDWSEEKNGPWEPPRIENPRCAKVPGCGPWSPPMIDNPRYKGEWSPPLIPNPAYQGKWVPQKILNPDYFEDNHPYSSMTSIDAITFELWTLSDGIVFDNILVTSDLTLADSIAMSTYQIKKELNDLETDNWFKRLIKQTNKKPWLWAVYIMATAVPVILFIGFCCVTPGSSSSSSTTTASSSSTKNSPSTSSSTLSSNPSTVFDCSHQQQASPSTSSMETSTINDPQHYHHHPFTDTNCKINHHHHHQQQQQHDQYAFRYTDAYNSADSPGCSSSEILEPGTSGLRSRFTSGSQKENVTITGYCSSSYQQHHQHSHSHLHQSTLQSAPMYTFRSACMKQVIPDEEEEEDDLADEMRAMEMELEMEQDDLINHDDDTINYDGNYDDVVDEDEDEGKNDDQHKYNYHVKLMDENNDFDVCGSLESYSDEPTTINGDDDHLISPSEDNESIPIESEPLTLINQKQYNNSCDQINESNDQLKGNVISEDNYLDDCTLINNNYTDDGGQNVEDNCSISAVEFTSIENGFNGITGVNCSDDQVDQVTSGNQGNQGDINEEDDNEQLNEPIQDVDPESHVNTSRSENPSVRRRKKGKGRRKNEGTSGPKEGNNNNGTSGKPGNGKGKSRRTKARRE